MGVIWVRECKGCRWEGECKGVTWTGFQLGATWDLAKAPVGGWEAGRLGGGCKGCRWGV